MTAAIGALSPSFVEEIPEKIAPGTLYVSIAYATVVHSCCCGCGEEVVTPLTPTDWRMTFDGENVSLWPSVGSWTLPCRSHYIVDRGKIRWAKPWTEKQIAAERTRDQAAKTAYFNHSTPADAAANVPDSDERHADELASRPSFRDRLRTLGFGFFGRR